MSSNELGVVCEAVCVEFGVDGHCGLFVAVFGGVWKLGDAYIIVVVVISLLVFWASKSLL